MNIGKVIWFDSRKGYGFLKVINSDSEYVTKEIFVHYTNIKSEGDLKRLFPGEIVSLDVVKNEGDDIPEGKEYSAQNITGVYETKLLVDNEDYYYKAFRKNKETTRD
jgi:cold shock CspA family protein